MKVTIIHGQTHHGSTYHLTHTLVSKLNCSKEDISEFTVNDIPYCVGCFQCIFKDEHLCPHRKQLDPIITALENADVIIMDSPNYVMSMSGQLKAFCDHLAYRWMSHRPNGEMKKKIAVAVSTTAGMGAKTVTKHIATQFRWWSVGQIYQLPFTVAAASWDDVSDKTRNKIDIKTDKLANKINKKSGNVRFNLKGRFIFFMNRNIQRGLGYNPVDVEWWENHGWIKKKKSQT